MAKIEHYVNLFIKDKETKLSESTMINYLTYTNKYILPYWKGKEITDINITDTEKFRDEIYDNVSFKTASNIMSVLKQILDIAVRDNVIPNNPCRYLKPKVKPNSNKKEIKIQNEEILKLLDKSKNSLLKGGIGVIIQAKLGLRRNEVLGLKWKNICLEKENPYIEVENALNRVKSKVVENKKVYFELGSTKTLNSMRKIYISDEFKEFFITYRNLYIYQCLFFNNECFVLPNNIQNPDLFMLPSKYEYYFNSIKKEACVKNKITLHSLRHYFISNKIHDGVPIDIVKKWVGHKSINTTIDTYTYTSEENLIKFKDKI